MTRTVPPVACLHMLAALAALVVGTVQLARAKGTGPHEAIVLPLGIWRIRHGDVRGHAGAMRNLNVGGLIVAGVFTLSPGRLLGNLLWKGRWACQ